MRLYLTVAAGLAMFAAGVQLHDVAVAAEGALLILAGTALAWRAEL